MGNEVELVALKGFGHSVGFVEAGKPFKASRTYAKGLIKEGIARLKHGSEPVLEAGRKRRWEGAAVIILASGPSLTAEDVERVRAWRMEVSSRPRRVIAINTTFKLAPFADVLYAADTSWWKVYADETAEAFKGERWTQSEQSARQHGLKLVNCERRSGLSKVEGIIHNGGNSLYQAIGAAVDWGVTEGVLLGADMQKTGGKAHWHEDHPKPLRNSAPFDKFLTAFRSLARDLKEANIRFVNATPTTALKEFEQLPLEEALARLS